MTSRTSNRTALRRVLIANDSLDGMDIALAKAAKIEHYSGAEIQLAEVIYDTIAEEPEAVLPRHQQAQLIEGMKAAERNGLKKLIEPYRSRVASIDQHVIWNKNATEGIVEHATDFDLLIKPVSRHSNLVDRLSAPLDWSLMRAASAPVLISKQAWSDTSILVAAVDVADTDHEALNRHILMVADELANIVGARVHVICAYPSLGQKAGELQVAMDYEGIKSDMRESRAQLIDRLLEDLKLDVEQIHLLEGKPGSVIPTLANELGAQITVLGTAARRGLSQLIIGNTAERIIEAINGDIVTVREAAR
jgi:universal stress protein E